MSDAKADRKQYQITVNGNRFAIASPHGEEHIRKVESFLEQQISTIQQSSSSISSVSYTHLTLPTKRIV